MAKHAVSFSIPQRDLGRSDVKFVVKKDGAVFGTLAVSNGSLVWFPKSTSYGCKMNWSKVDKLMEENATRLEKR